MGKANFRVAHFPSCGEKSIKAVENSVVGVNNRHIFSGVKDMVTDRNAGPETTRDHAPPKVKHLQGDLNILRLAVTRVNARRTAVAT